MEPFGEDCVVVIFLFMNLLLNKNSENMKYSHMRRIAKGLLIWEMPNLNCLEIMTNFYWKIEIL